MIAPLLCLVPKLFDQYRDLLSDFRTQVTEFGNIGSSGEGEMLSYVSLQEI